MSSVEERLWSKVDVRGADECWPWTASTRNGYGQIYVGQGRVLSAHRVIYRLTWGDPPPGFDIDHTCHNGDLGCEGGADCRHRRCCNPVHLEAVEHGENIRRSHVALRGGWEAQAAKTHCPRGHAYSEENTYLNPRPDGKVARRCRTCEQERERNRPSRKRPSRRRRA